MLQLKNTHTEFTMPTAVTHQLLAEEVYKKLPYVLQKKVLSLPHYYFGAQGCDVCFFYKILTASSDNFGRFLHKNQPLLFFNILLQESKKDEEVRSYAYGYITQSAADTVFHPHIYQAMGGEGTLLHHAIEHAYDGALLKRYRQGEGLSFYRLPRPEKGSLDGVYTVYARYARESGWGCLSKKGFTAAVRRYYAFASMRTPFFRKKYAEKAEVLFEQAIKRSVSLIESFESDKKSDLKAEAFGRHYLSGEIV
ncbi:MAG: hypothetical protein IJY26_01735 [Clostridia bacterium]|nr:hypothetical protein [Clostridia bacterium]